MDVCPITARRVCEAVVKRAQTFDEESRLGRGRHCHVELSSTCVPPTVLQLAWKDLTVGKLLGQGTFSSVYQVTCSELNQEVALKILRKRAMRSSRSFEAGAIDLVMESKLLERLRHDNIIRLVGKKGGCLDKCFLDSGYFLVLEKLHGTLQEKLRIWEKQDSNSTGSSAVVGGVKITNPAKHLRCYNTSEDVQQLHGEHVPSLLHRLAVIATGIASAMEYLHERNICFRDLKPQNVGFALDGTVRLFDFGLALELPNGTKGIRTTDLHHHHQQQHDLSGQTGTTRYMAPENALCKPYGLPCDVYSFGLVLWEIVTLKVAYKKLTPSQHAERVVLGKVRPPLAGLVDQVYGNSGTIVQGQISPRLSHLMESCWHEEPKSRPDFATICRILQQEEKSGFYLKAAEQEEYKKKKLFFSKSKCKTETSSDYSSSQEQPQGLSQSWHASASRRARRLMCLSSSSHKNQEQVDLQFSEPMGSQGAIFGTPLEQTPATPRRQRPPEKPHRIYEHSYSRQDGLASSTSRRTGKVRIYEQTPSKEESSPPLTEDFLTSTQRARMLYRYGEGSATRSRAPGTKELSASQSRRATQRPTRRGLNQLSASESHRATRTWFLKSNGQQDGPPTFFMSKEQPRRHLNKKSLLCLKAKQKVLYEDVTSSTSATFP